MPSDGERSVRVSTLELFFDLVFVLSITQLTAVLVDGGDAESVVRVVVMLLLIWWMYDGYAWLTNAIATDRLRYRLALIGGMGGFLVIALAIPRAYDGAGLAFGLGYLAVIALHAAMYVRGTSVSEVAAILRLVPYNLAAGALVLVGGALGGDAQWVVGPRRRSPLGDTVAQLVRGLRRLGSALRRAPRPRGHRRARRVDRRRRRRLRGARP